MKRKITVFIAAAALSGLVLASAALGHVSSASSPQAPKGALVTLGKTTLGKVLVDARGRTLYLFEKDKRGKSACYGACATYWPPLVSSAKPRAARGVRASLLGVTKRTDGKRQVTYAGHPLYTFSLDTRAGQTSGQGLTDFGGTWAVVAASGRAVKSTASSGSSGGSSGYGGYGHPRPVEH
jgi:predicted lipoprotein with Yx(FWY)xxD motif